MANELIKELSPHRHWLVYKKESVTKGKNKGRITKVPYQPNGYKARSTDPNSWTTYDNAQEEAEAGKFDGIGYALTATQRYVCIDLDHCVDSETWAIDPWALDILDIVKKAGGTYVEFSPSGTGLHIWGRGELPNNKGVHSQMKNGHDIEMYTNAHYMTVTGKPLNDIPLNNIQPAIDTILSMLKNSPADRKSGGPAATPYCEGPKLSDKEVIEKIRKSRSGPKFHALYDRGDTSLKGDDQSSADQVLFSMLAYRTENKEQIKRIFLSSKLAKTLDRKEGHEEDYLNRSIKKALDFVREKRKEKAEAARKQEEEGPAFLLNKQNQPMKCEENLSILLKSKGISI